MTTQDKYLRALGSAVMSLASDAIFIIDATTLRITQANRAFTRAFGYEPHEVPELSLYDLTGSDREAVDANLAELASVDDVMLGVRPYRCRDGTIVEMETRVGAADVDGHKLFCVVARDLTEIRQAERSQRESEARSRTLADVAFEGIAITENGRIVDVNRRCTELLRAPATDLLGRAVSDFVARESMDKVTVQFRADSQAPYEHMARRADGTVFPVEVQAKSITLGGRTLRVTALRDITQRRNLEEQVRLAQRMESVGRLAGGVAHDFNNLLTVILSLTRLLDQAPNNEANAEDVAQIRAAGERAAALTQQLLAFARRQIVKPETLDLNGLVTNLDKMLRRVIGEDIELASICQADLGRVRADSGQIEQVLLNLAVNARDAMPSGGKLTLETANVTLGEDYTAKHPEVAPGEYVMVSVSDTGGGIDAATMRHIFEPFFTTKMPGKGTGLGLATCYGIVKQSGGSIWVYSEIGQGTTFKVYLPRVWDTVAQRAPERIDLSPGGNETLLMVEDNDMVRRLAVRILKAQGYRVLEAGDGIEALAVYEANHGDVDLVITDVILPRMSGKQLADRLREARPDIKILYTSGYTENTIVHHGIVDENVNFLPKPYVANELLRRIRQVLGET